MLSKISTTNQNPLNTSKTFVRNILENPSQIAPKSFQIGANIKEIGARGYPKEATRSEDDKSSGGV